MNDNTKIKLANPTHLWRDDARLTPVAGAPYDQAVTDERLLFGDYTGGAFGDNFDVTLDYVEYCASYKGNQIYNGTNYINNWTTVTTGGTLASTLIDTDDLRLINASTGGTWLEGTNTAWSANNDGNWTFEMRAKFNNLTNGFAIWLGTGTNIVRVEIYTDRTQDFGGNTFNVGHNNSDGEFHDFRIVHDAAAAVYHVFRDGIRLTPISGVTYDSSSSEERLILGDTTGGTFGDAFDITIDEIRIDYTGVWIPLGTDTDSDGMPDTWENTYYDDPLSADPTNDDDDDGRENLEEYLADTDPTQPLSHFHISAITATSPDNFDISVAQTSTRRNYTLFASNDLGIMHNWTPVSDALAGKNGNLIFRVTNSSHRFYRVEVTPL